MPPEGLRGLLGYVVNDREEQGHDVTGVRTELAALPASYDVMVAFAERLADLPLRGDWPYVEPDDLDAIRAECDPPEPVPYDLAAVAPRIETAWLARVAGCILGKPIEVDPTLAELRAVLEPRGEWPLTDYVTEAATEALRARQWSWPETVSERIAYAAEDDDLNYTVLALTVLEEHGGAFTQADLRKAWLLNLPVGMTFGPERTHLLNVGLSTMSQWGGHEADPARWTYVLNPDDEHCGALIRADAYGYACPGDPWQAATLAHRDATLTHRRTGSYATMWVAAAVATALVADDWRTVAETAIRVVPRRSRLHEVLARSYGEVLAATDWLDGYDRIHGAYAEYTHCRVYQELGTLLNTLRFAPDATAGIGIQVSQGNDTDSFGATSGSLLGALHGPAGFDRDHWLGRFHDTIHVGLALVHEQSLTALAARMAALPAAVTGLART